MAGALDYLLIQKNLVERTKSQSELFQEVITQDFSSTRRRIALGTFNRYLKPLLFLQLHCQLQHPYNVRPILIDPRPIVLADHVPVGMPHLFGYPVN